MIMDREKNYLFLYLAITFGVWWGTALCFLLFGDSLTKLVGELTLLHPLIIFFTYLPSITGLTLYYLMGGSTAVKIVISKLIPRKQDLFWFPVLFVVFMFFVFFMRFGSLFFGIAVPKITYNMSQMISEIFLNFVRETGIIGGTFGWVGFLLPCLQGKLKNNISSGLLTGLIFGLWLFPGFAFSSSTEISFALYVIQLMLFFLFQSYVFNATQGSLVFYLFSFGLISAGSHIQLYYFNVPIQVMQIVYFTAISLIFHIISRKIQIDAPLQTLSTLIPMRNETRSDQQVILRNKVL